MNFDLATYICKTHKKINSYKLTAREKECLKLVLLGFSASSIAQKLSISSRTAEEHIQNLCKKCEVQGSRSIAGKLLYDFIEAVF